MNFTHSRTHFHSGHKPTLFSVPHLSDSTTAHPAVQVKHLDSHWTFLCLKKIQTSRCCQTYFPIFLVLSLCFPHSSPHCHTRCWTLTLPTLIASLSVSSSGCSHINHPPNRLHFQNFKENKTLSCQANKKLQLLSISLNLACGGSTSSSSNSF